MSKQLKGRIGLTIVAIIWGSGFVFSSISLNYFSAYQVLAIRFILAFLMMLLFYSRHLKEVTTAVLKKGFVLGIFLYLAFMFQTVGLIYTTPSKNAFITAFNVVLVPVITSVLYKRKLNKPSIIGAILSIVGIAIMSLESFTQVNKGDLLTLAAALFFALQIIYTNEFLEKENIYLLTTAQFGTAGLLGLGVSLFKNDIIQPLEVQGIIAAIYLGAVSTMLAFLLQTASQRYTTETETAIILSTESVFGMIFSAILLKEIITVKMLIGSFFILSGVMIVQLVPSADTLEEKRQYGKEKNNISRHI